MAENPRLEQIYKSQTFLIQHTAAARLSKFKCYLVFADKEDWVLCVKMPTIMGATQRFFSGQRSFALKIASYVHTLLKFFKASLLLMSQRYRSANLRFKIAFFTVILLTSTSFILCIMTLQIMNNYILNEIIKRGESVGRVSLHRQGTAFCQEISWVWILLFIRQSHQIVTCHTWSSSIRTGRPLSIAIPL